MVYGGLFLGWLWHGPPLWWYRVYPDLVLGRWVLPFLVCLLLSHWFVKRGEFWAAGFTLVFWALFLAAGLFRFAICGALGGTPM
jgi:hypothetical protein